MKRIAKVASVLMMLCMVAFNAVAESNVKHINQEEFRTQIFDFVNNNTFQYKGTRPCIIDFYATWCGPCRSISPYLDELSVKYKGQVDIYKIDVDQNKDIARAFGATSIPLLIFIPVGEDPQAQRGALPKEELERAINTVLKVPAPAKPAKK